MSDSIQKISDIAPMAGSAGGNDGGDPVKADYDQGKRYLAEGNLTQAAVSLHNALLGYEEKGDETGTANASNQLGHVCLAKKDYIGAEIHYQRSWDICTGLNDSLSLFSLSKRFVEVYRGQKNYEKAISVCFDILDGHQRNNNPRGTVELLEDLAAIYLEAGMKEKAADTYRTIASIHRNFKHKSIAESFDKKAKELAADG